MLNRKLEDHLIGEIIIIVIVMIIITWRTQINVRIFTLCILVILGFEC